MMNNQMDNAVFCSACPRLCNGLRDSEHGDGFCNSSNNSSISSVCIHKGEEPVLSEYGKGVVNVFFTGCNLRCVYCQNHQISHASEKIVLIDDYFERIINFLDLGYNAVGFVSPSHYTQNIKRIIRELNAWGYHPVTIYNSNGYDSVNELKDLEGLIDIYLPDFKYVNNNIAERFSSAGNYKEVALNAIKEMYRQKGSMLLTDEKGTAVSGLIIRHLVLPGYIDNSLGVLEEIAGNISTSVAISLMAQYNPIEKVLGIEGLNRRLTTDEYNIVTDKFYELGFYKGWLQDIDSSMCFNPDFTNQNPFD